MKGVVFTEFFEMLHAKVPLETIEGMIAAADFQHDCAYTAVGTYPHEEMITLVGLLSEETGVPASDLVAGFGKHLFGRFTVLYPELFREIGSVREFCRRLDGFIHVEVRKLYHDAELPRFLCSETDDGSIRMSYRSSRPFADLAQGLFEGCAAHYGERIRIRREPCPEDPSAVDFVLQPRE